MSRIQFNKHAHQLRGRQVCLLKNSLQSPLAFGLSDIKIALRKHYEVITIIIIVISRVTVL